jgi:hypothetical protein
VARWVVESWAAIPVRVIVRASVVTGGDRVCYFSAEDRVTYDLDNLKIDPLIIHLVDTKGASWGSVSTVEENSPADTRARQALSQVRLGGCMCLSQSFSDINTLDNCV